MTLLPSIVPAFVLCVTGNYTRNNLKTAIYNTSFLNMTSIYDTIADEYRTEQ